MNRNYPIWILIAALVLVFGWFGIDKFLNPILWVGFLPLWMDGLLGMDKTVWITIVGASEVGMAVMLLVPHRLVRILGTIFVILHLIAVLMQVGINDVGIRDMGLLLAAVALLLLLHEQKHPVTA